MSKEIKIRESQSPDKQEVKRQMGYAQEFHDLLRTHPGAMKDFFQSVEGFKDAETAYREKAKILGEGILVEAKRVPARKGADRTITSQLYYVSEHTSAYKVQIGDQNFFVKIQKRDDQSHATPDTGFTDFLSTKLAQERLEGVPDMEVVDFQFGYKTKNSDIFISRFIDLRPEDRLDKYLDGLYRKFSSILPSDPHYNSRQVREARALHVRLSQIPRQVLGYLGEEFYNSDLEDTKNYYYRSKSVAKRLGPKSGKVDRVICFDLHSSRIASDHTFTRTKSFAEKQADLARRFTTYRKTRPLQDQE